ncbi:MAG: polyphosphate kinase 2 family protein [Gemmatimonadetes bacterium]|nr:polyphosphate kinase 2 family protein [Gemmatimonadota bacterium]MBT8405001.1 polyphosphate kinase 2 family protein [Gemmatimonadota bacterium]NNK64505.1 polyphosphate kinase 2 family protein [Gemmatimonadota bacterium]
MHPVPSPYLVPFDGSFRLADAPQAPPVDAPSEKKLEDHLDDLNEELADLQRVLYAHNRYALLLVFQAMDAAGKDGTIRKVLRGTNPAGCQVFSFKKPSSEELDHDFLWRVARRLPERGRIGVFNRSHYEEVLVVRVHPEYLAGQNLPVAEPGTEAFWSRRLSAIETWERHLADTGTVVVKFFLNVSREEQRQRFLARLDEPDKNWKFNVGDVEERRHWDAYMDAYEAALSATSRPWAPWYAVPADDKDYMRATVAGIVVDTLKSLPLAYPPVAESDRARFAEMRALLEAQGG